MAREDHIRQRAYEIYIARGGEDGQDTNDWLEAERQLAEQPVEQQDGEASEVLGAAVRGRERVLRGSREAHLRN